MTKNDKTLREHLLYLLRGGGAHTSFDAVIQGLPVALRGKRPKGAAHSPWEIMEHMRLAQWDILEFSRNPEYVPLEFPSGYWPKAVAPPSDRVWTKCVRAFQADLDAMCKLVTAESTNLFAPIAHGDGQTVLREALLVADHNAYHLGEMVLMRRLLGAWQK